MGQIRTFSAENQFSFVCPVFAAETRIADCLALRDIVWKGQRPAQRQGCQACMSASKCPMNAIIQDIGRSGSDPYYSVEAKLGSLNPGHIERIAPIVVLDRQLNLYSLSPEERDAILSANERARKSADGKTVKPRNKGVKLGAVEAPEYHAPAAAEASEAPKTRRKPTEPAVDALEAANDLGAAITAAVEKSTETPAESVSEPAAPETPAGPESAPGRPLTLLERARLRNEGRAAR